VNHVRVHRCAPPACCRELIDGADPAVLGSSPRGTIVFYSRGEGHDSWSDQGGALSAGMMAGLRHDGFRTVEVRWVDSWRVANAGERAGYGLLSCRPSTTVQWAHDHLYTPSPVASAAPGHCGFCVTGNSDGASQLGYAHAFYGLDHIIDVAVPTSGPAMAAQEQGCTDVPGFTYLNSTDRHWVDEAYGYVNFDGPCATHGAGFDFGPVWRANSVDSAGNDYCYPRTRVHFNFEGQDLTNMPNHGRTYEHALLTHGSPMVSEQVVADMGHPVQESVDGLAALRTALEA